MLSPLAIGSSIRKLRGLRFCFSTYRRGPGKCLLIHTDDIMEKGKDIPLVPIGTKMKMAVLEMASKRGICMILDEKK